VITMFKKRLAHANFRVTAILNGDHVTVIIVTLYLTIMRKAVLPGESTCVALQKLP
jgi:hypothetical protein